MKNDSLWEKAVYDYNSAVIIWNNMDGDEMYLNNIGYLLQQSVEKSMKHLLEASGVDYPKTHEIGTLIRIADEENADLYLTDYIYDNAELLSVWETYTRYVTNYRADCRKIERAIKNVGEYLETIAKNVPSLTCDDIERKSHPDGTDEPKL